MPVWAPGRPLRFEDGKMVGASPPNLRIWAIQNPRDDTLLYCGVNVPGILLTPEYIDPTVGYHRLE